MASKVSLDISKQVTPQLNSSIIKTLEKEISFEKLGLDQFDKNALYNLRFVYSNNSKTFYLLDPNFIKLKRVVVEDGGTGIKWNDILELSTTEDEIISQVAPLKVSIRGNSLNYLATTFISKSTKNLKFKVMREKTINDSIKLEKINDQDIVISKIEVFDESNAMSNYSMIEELKDGSLIIGVRSLKQFYELQRQWENQEPSYTLAGYYPLPCKTIRMCKLECNTHGTEYLAFSLEDCRIALIYINNRDEVGKLNLNLIQYIDSICGKYSFSPSNLVFVKNLNVILVSDAQENPKDKKYYRILEAFQLQCRTFNHHNLEFAETLLSFDENILPICSVFDETDGENKSYLLVASANLKKLSVYNLDRSEPRSVFCIRGKDNGRPAWHYVLVDTRQKRFKLKDQTKGSNIDVKDYGRIVKSGWGEDPPKEVMKEIEEEYGS